MKRTLCILLSLMLAVTGFAGLCVPASAADCQVGDIIAFGSYPQSRVTDDATINTLNAAADGWQSYGYYSSWGSPADGSMSPKDYMQYCDVTVNGQKYRGVQCTQYRPKCTGYSASADNSYIDDNGYAANTVYWFRYESLYWRVLDPVSGLVLCETIIDSQPVNSYALQEGGKYYGDADKAHYANNYAESSLRTWLNDDFYSTAFTASQQDMITVTTLDNSAYSTGFSGFDSASTTDKVFLLSYKEAQNTAYGFCSDINASDAARKAEGSDYAKCQGLSVTSGGTSPWWLRSAGYTSAAVCSVHAAGSLYYNYSAYYTYFGVRPAVTVDLDAVVVPYWDGDVIEFGSYLQGKLTNEESIAALEAAAPDFSQWTSYSYYTGTGNNTDGSMTASDYMRYCEITLGDKKYRGVRFTQYRPWMTGMKSTKSASEQDDHGYETDTTYWFRYRPLQWRVLDAQKGILLCETLIDSQPMNSYVLESGTDDYGETAYWGDADQSRYANNYAGSDLRQWLNNDFLNAAFSPKEQAVLTYTTLDNSADESVSRPAYGSETTTDRVFLLSYADAQNAAYGFSDNDSRLMKGSGYAKCQGLSVSSSYSPWLLRSPGNGSREMILVNNKGAFITTNYSYVTHFGIRPAISVDMDALYALLNHVHSFDAPKWNWAGDRSSATAIFTCADCGETKSVTDESPAEIDVTAANCTDDKTVAYTASVKLDGMVYTNTSNAVAVPDTALGHDYSVVHETVAPTAADEGYTLYECSRCGDVDPMRRDVVPPTSADGKVPVRLIPDKTKVRPGGTITYTVKIGPVTEMTGADLWLVLPDGLTVDDYDLSAAYAANDPDAALRFSPTNMQFLIFSIAQRPYTTAEETDLMTFICSVDSGASGEKIIELTKCEFAGQAQPSIPTTYDPAGSAVTVVTDSATIITGDTIRFGSYPQSLVKDSATLTALNAAAPDSESWTSYGYYSGTGDEVDGQMTAKDYMQYCDVTVNGMKYRGVRFSQYRPFSTGDDSTADNTLQIENGYTTDTIYWFHWDPLQWRVLDPDAGLLLCENAIDAQPYQNLLWRNGNKYYQGVNSTVYANDYATSSVREWLNSDFLNAAFTSEQKSMIAETTLDNRANGTKHPIYDSAETTDKVFLLSSREAANAAYGFNAVPDADDDARMTIGTDYALCQGVEVDENHVHWLLRSAGYISDTVCAADQYGGVGDFYGTASTTLGIRPAITVDLENYVTPYKTGDLVEYGSYPQSRVTDDATIDALNAAAPDSESWTSYGYYSGEGSNTADGQMTAKDYMRYCDVTVDGQKYRGVTFSSYRPNNTGYKSSEWGSAQHDNGYRTGVTYWFRYEPLQWRVLDPATGLVLCETLIDSQAYNNYALFAESDGNKSYWGDAGMTHYANNYAESSLRQWLNDDFLGTAFTAEEEKRIAPSTLDNSDYSTDHSDYDSVSTTDKVFLLSWKDALNPAYGFSTETGEDDPARRTTSTEYAKCQGVAVSSRNGCSSWYLRSAGEYSGCVCAVIYDGWTNVRYNAYVASTGIRPAMTLDLYLLNPPAHVHAYGAPVWDWANDYSSATATFTCADCGDTQTVTDDGIDVTVVSAEDCTNDRVVKYTASVEFNGTNYTETTNEVAVPGTATGHTFAWVTDTEPTCGADGVKHEECSVCHAKQNEGTPIPATGNHSWEWIVDTDETCGIDGVKHEECSVCHAKQNEGTPIPATGRHNFAEWVDNPAMTATCTEAGQEISRCTRCDTLGTRDKAALGHEYTVLHETIEPTCTADGYSTYECVRCGDVDPTHKDIVKALNHDWKTEWSKDDVNHWHACTRCDEKNDEAAHTYGDVSYTWEQTAGTWKATAKRTCTVCKWDETETVTAAGVKSKEPTCTVNGETTYTASFSNTAFETQTKTVADIASLGHAYDAVVTEPTCTEDGYTTHTCSRCGDSYTDSETDALGHTEAAPVKEKETAATCETDGSFEEVVYCTLCGAELSRKTVVIPALGHEDADNNGHCDRCDEQMTGGDHCAWCGKIHNCCTICGMLTRCFHTFLYKVKPYILPALCFASSAFLLWLILK